MNAKISTVSVIIPTLQEEEYIAATLSRLVKVKPPLEIIIVDSGSRDNTVKIARHFTNKVYKIRERGISKARNYGAKRATGDILLFLDADIIFPTNFVEKLLRTFGDARVTGATCQIMPKSGLTVTAFFLFYNLLIRLFAKFKPHSRGEFFAVRRDCFFKVNGFDETVPCLEDHELAHRLSKLGRFVFIGNLTVHESMRRFRKLGFWRVVGTWLIDYLSFTIRGKPVSGVWKPIR